MRLPRNQVYKGRTLPYGTLAGASPELTHAYYSRAGTNGYKNDSDIPDLPCPPFELEETDTVEDVLQAKEMALLVRELLEILPPRRALVMRMRYGIDADTERTLEEVGKQFDVTRERIRQIEKRGLRRLRAEFQKIGIKSTSSLATW